MSGRGLHLALTDEELQQLSALDSSVRSDHIANVLEEKKFGSEDACETDKAWTYINAALTGSDPDGPLNLPAAQQSKPRSFLNKLRGRYAGSVGPAADATNAILGCRSLLFVADYYIGFVPAADVGKVSDALEQISTDTLGQRVRDVHARHRASGSADDAAGYAMSWYSGLVEFFSRAARANKHVIFTVDF